MLSYQPRKNVFTGNLQISYWEHLHKMLTPQEPDTAAV